MGVVKRLRLACALVAVAATARAAQIEDVSPRGTVKQPRQVTVRFGAPMVALGDPRAAAPFAVACTPPVAGSGHWIDSRTYAVELARELPGGERCAIDLLPDLRDRAGRPVEGERHFEFSTGGPSVTETRPAEGSEIAEDQAFVLVLDADPKPASVEAHAYFAADGIAERIPVAIASADVRTAILALDPDDRPTGPVLVLQARQRFPAEAAVKLVWGPGIESATGIATAEEQSFEYKTRPAFRAEIRCERESARAGCVPLAAISLRFTASVDAAAAARVALVGPDGKRFAQEPPDTPDPQVTRVTFAPPFPPATALRVDVPADLHDDAGRPLANADELRTLPLQVDAVPPLAKFAARFGILEAKADPALPVTIRGLEPAVRTQVLDVGAQAAGAKAPASEGDAKTLRTGASATAVALPTDRPGEIIRWLLRVAGARRDRSVFAGRPLGDRVRSFDLPQPDGQAMQVVGLPLERPGIYVVELASRALGTALLDADKPMYVSAAALVTDVAVHFQWGRESSLVWVTSLEKANPIPDADVAVHDCAGKVLWQGRSDADGIARIGRLPREVDLPVCKDPTSDDEPDESHDYEGSRVLSNLTSGIFVTARSGDDLGFVHSSWNEGIENFRWNLPSEPWQGPYAAHTILARALLRAGETAYMKHVFRVETGAGFALAKPDERPSRLVVRHVGSDTEIPLPLVWNADGTAETAWAIPREAKLGRYQVVLLRPARGEAMAPGANAGASAGRDPAATPTPPPPYVSLGSTEESQKEWIAGELRVEEFRVPLLRASLQLPAGPLVAPHEVPADVAIRYLAGGAAGGLPITVRSRVAPADLVPAAGLEGFAIANGAVEAGIERLGGEAASDGAGGDAGGNAGAASRARGAVATREQLRLDAAGAARALLRDLPPVRQPAKLLVEVEFRDPNGESQTASASTPLWPAALVPALQAEYRRDAKRKITADVAVIDPAQKPVAGVPVVVEAFRRFTYTNRQRVVGGFYAYQDVEETRRLKTLCRGRTDAAGRLRCVRRAPSDGDLIVQARIADAEGRPSAAHVDVWVPGRDDAWFRMADGDRIDLIPERKRWEPGETARLQVRMPFRRATALVTVAREGVLDARVVELAGKDPAVEVPIRDAYSPNAFVEVLAVRGRVASISPTALVDLGKPAFKLGIAPLDVGWRPHEINVNVAPERSVVEARATVHVDIAAAASAGEALPSDAAVAVAAVDEGLLELLPNPSVDLLSAMMGRRGDLVETSTSQLEVVGKRHFGKKAMPTGGGGGRQATRELFDTLLLWRGRVPLDAAGRAAVDVPLNDSLTSFRIVAVATAGAGLFGTGEATIRATKDLMVLSGLPPVVRTGDRYRAEFTVRNTTDRPLSVAVSGRAAGLAEPELAARDVALAPGEAKVVAWDVVAPASEGTLRFVVAAQADGGAADRLAVEERVAAAVPVRTLQATLAQAGGPEPLAEPIARPADALPGRGGIEVALAPSVAAGLAGVRDWMARYPYRCLEQRISRAIALGDDALWSETAAAIASSLDGDGLAKFFPSLSWGDPSLTAYAIEVSRAAKRDLPAPALDRMKQGLRAFIDGTLSHREPVAPDLTLRKLEAAAALAAAGVDEPGLVSSISIEPALWPTSAVLDWWTFLLRTRSWPARERGARLAEAEQVLRARLELGGTALAFSGGGPSDAGRPFAREDVDAVRLAWLAVDSGAWRPDQARVVRGALARQRRGRWETTVANAWGTVAIGRFAAAWESAPVAGETVARLGATARTLGWSSSPAGGALDFPWPDAPGELAIEQRGTGRPWVTVTTRAAIPLAAPLVAGYRIARSTTAIDQRAAGRWSVGDTLRVRLEIEAASDLPWVVVDDPVPAGASFLARGFATDSSLAAPTPAADDAADAVLPAYEEKTFEAYRAYYERVAAGRLVVEYAIRLNQAGTFQMPPTHVEALYAPEMLGELPNDPVEVAP